MPYILSNHFTSMRSSCLCMLSELEYPARGDQYSSLSQFVTGTGLATKSVIDGTLDHCIFSGFIYPVLYIGFPRLLSSRTSMSFFHGGFAAIEDATQ